MYCKNCGQYNSDEKEYCTKCGEKLNTVNIDEPTEDLNVNGEQAKKINWKLYLVYIFIGILIIGICIIGYNIFTLLKERQNQETVQQTQNIAADNKTNTSNLPVTDANDSETYYEEPTKNNSNSKSINSSSSSSSTSTNNTDNSFSYSSGIHSYGIYKGDLDWYDAVEMARSKGGYLAHIDSEEEYNTILNRIREERNAGLEVAEFYIGAKRDDSSNYKWVDKYGNVMGSPINNKLGNWFFYDGEPSFYDSDSDTSEDVLIIMHITADGSDYYSGNDVNNDILSIRPNLSGKIGYIVEYE